MSTPSRKTLLLAVRQIVGAFALTVEQRVPGKIVCVEWPAVVESVLVDDKEAVRAVEWALAENAKEQS